MDLLTMVLIRNELNIPLDIIIFINGWVKYKPLNDENIREATKLWFGNRKECRFKFGDIKYWDTTNITNMKELFQYKTDFNEDLSGWDVSNVEDMSQMFYCAT